MGHANLCRGPELNWRHMVLQTIALPTELPRREPHSIGDSRRRSRIEQINGLKHYVRLAAQWSPDASTTTSRPLPNIGVAKCLHHCPCRTIARACDSSSSGSTSYRHGPSHHV